MRTARNILVHELIGLHVRVVRATAPEYHGLEGRVVDETKHLLVVRTERGVKKVPKLGTLFEFTLPDGEKVLVEGSLILYPPEERTKRLWRKVFPRRRKRP